MEDIYLTNTLSKKKERFVPRKENEVSLYVCGMTVQDYPHLGHARAYITFDTIKRFFKHRGFVVKHIQNYTDIDDKIIAKANAEGVSTEEIAKKYTKAYIKDMKQLDIEPADYYPLATEHISDIISMIQGLIDKGSAYQIDGDVYYSVRSKKDYGKLSGRSLEDLRAGERVEIDLRKKDPMDFALWKSSKPGEPAWDSPWGPGRPGWHIECSAMSLKHLGMSFDIHGGGQDLIFPHHENEIAQSESYTGKEPFARYWVHNGFVNLNAEKMSKSTGNFIYLYQLLERYDGHIIRLFVLSTHYRSPVDFTEDGLVSAQSSLEGLLAASREAGSVTIEADEPHTAAIEKLYRSIEENHQIFDDAMADDFNTPGALAALYALKDEINGFIKTVKNRASADDIDALLKARHSLIWLAAVLGLNLETSSYIVTSDRARPYNSSEMPVILNKIENHLVEKDLEDRLLKAIIEEVIEMRLHARASRNFEDSDFIRNTLADKGIILEDTKAGTRYYAKPW